MIKNFVKYPVLLFFLLILISCKDDVKEENNIEENIVAPKLIERFGYILNDFKVVEDTIRNGDSFGEILYKNHVEYPEVYKIVENCKDSFDIRKLIAGKPYTILAKKDTTEKAQVFIYHPSKTEYVVIDFRDSIYANNFRKTIKTITRTASGSIESS
ncbi:MAG: M23 family peptidase, partial [Flavobacteriaceae bacterium]|nr:M23 family peptidase [Flavobacteriaceae bacterium]